jgi:arginase family enzyme
MPFRALIEHCGVSSLACVGAVPLVNTRQHHEWFTKHGGIAYPYPSPPTPEQLIASHLSGPAHAFVSLDMDVMHMHQAPGVSAMNAAGLPADLIGRYLLACGASPSVRCFDIMELSPPHDESGRTARLAAQMFLMFLQGLAQRK